MRQRRQRWGAFGAACFALLVLPSCFLTHGRDRDRDAGNPPAVSDATTPVGPDVGQDAGQCLSFFPTVQCSEVTLPASAECPQCAEGGCHPLINVCMDGRNSFGDRREESCSAGGGACWRANMICAHDFSDPLLDWPRQAGGYGCVTLDYCRWIATQDQSGQLHPVTCFYGEGEPFLDGPPEAVCPEDRGNAAYPLCFGDCEPTCDLGSCFGMNEDRAFGVCSPGAGLRCSRDENPRGFPLDEQLLSCRFEAGEDCACMVPTPAAREGHGVVTPISTCRAYRAAYPDSVDCRDVNWNRLEN